MTIGDEVEVTVALDEEERVIIPPRPIQERLDADPALRAAWEKLSDSHQREWAIVRPPSPISVTNLT